MPIKITTIGFQQAKAALMKELKEFQPNVDVLIGIHEDAGDHEGDISNAQLGAALHFGAGNLAARPWLDAGVAVGAGDYNNIIRSAIENKTPLDTALNQIGVVAVAKVQQYMVELKTPPNTEATIKAKGSSNPLIDTGQLMQSVTYKVTTGGINES